MAIKFNRSQTFATNGTVTAAGLHNLIDGTDIYQALITDQPSLTSVATDDSILIADASLTAGDAPRQTTVSNLFDDALTAGTYTNLNLTGALTYGTATGNRTVSTSATITTGTIPNLTAGTTTSTAATITTGTIPTLTAGTTTSTAANITNGTIQTLTSSTATITGGTFSGLLNSSTGTFSGSVNSTSGTIATLNSTTGTISNLSTTLAGDFTISQGTGTIGTGTITAAKLANPQYTGFRNRIINGDMRIDQRNAGASQTFTAGAALAYSVDRFYGYCTGANVTGQRVAGTSPNEFAYRFTGATSVTGIGFGTRLEATNTIDLAGSTATLSVQLANSLLTTVTWTAYYASTADAFGTLASPTRTQIATGTFTVNSTLTTYSTQISIPSAATTGIEIVFTVGAQTSGTWTIDNVQLEAGSSATAFERRPYGTELALCQRYYCKTYSINTKPASITTEGALQTIGYSSNNYRLFCQFQFPSEMRSSPQVTMYSPNTGTTSCWYDIDGPGDYSGGGLEYAGTRSVSVTNPTGNATAGHRYITHVVASSEL